MKIHVKLLYPVSSWLYLYFSFRCNCSSRWQLKYEQQLSFWLNFSQVFHSHPCSCTLREHFYRKCTMDILPWSCLAMGVLIAMVTDLEVTLQNVGTVMCCDIAIRSLFLMVLLVVPLVWHCWFCPIIPWAFPRKSCNSPRGKWATLLGGFHFASFLAQPDFCRVMIY